MRVMDLSRSFALLLVPTLLVACGPKEEETVDPDAHHKVEADWVPEEMDPHETDESFEEAKSHEVDPPAEDPYADMSEEERMDKAKELYLEAENLAHEEKWKEAELKYEQAYHLVPGKHGFAYKVGTSAHKAGDCERAKMYLDHFITYADAEKQADRLKSAKKLRGILGC